MKLLIWANGYTPYDCLSVHISCLIRPSFSNVTAVWDPNHYFGANNTIITNRTNGWRYETISQTKKKKVFQQCFVYIVYFLCFTCMWTEMKMCCVSKKLAFFTIFYPHFTSLYLKLYVFIYITESVAIDFSYLEVT